GLLDVAGGFEIVLDAIELPLGFDFAKSSFHMLANFAGDSSGHETAKQQDDGVEADVGLRDRGRCAGSGRDPAEINGGGEIADGGGDAGEAADPGIQAQN